MFSSVEAAFDLVAPAVAGPDRSLAAGRRMNPSLSGWLLVGSLGDHRVNLAGTQRGPVRLSEVRLVRGQRIGPFPGPPHTDGPATAT
jgi:hypothetical protein